MSRAAHTFSLHPQHCRSLTSQVKVVDLVAVWALETARRLVVGAAAAVVPLAGGSRKAHTHNVRRASSAVRRRCRAFVAFRYTHCRCVDGREERRDGGEMCVVCGMATRGLVARCSPPAEASGGKRKEGKGRQRRKSDEVKHMEERVHAGHTGSVHTHPLRWKQGGTRGMSCGDADAAPQPMHIARDSHRRKVSAEERQSQGTEGREEAMCECAGSREADQQWCA